MSPATGYRLDPVCRFAERIERLVMIHLDPEHVVHLTDQAFRPPERYDGERRGLVGGGLVIWVLLIEPTDTTGHQSPP